MHITPVMVEGVYELLLTTPPFRSWKLPPADDIEFCILRTADRHGDYLLVNGRHRIRVSCTICQTLQTLILVMAHEMVHLKTGMQHGFAFRRAAASVCRYHGFDRATF